jgi:hypothetical protein
MLALNLLPKAVPHDGSRLLLGLIVRARGRLVEGRPSLDCASQARPSCPPFRERGPHSGHLRPVAPLPQREGLLALCVGPPAASAGEGGHTGDHRRGKQERGRKDPRGVRGRVRGEVAEGGRKDRLREGRAARLLRLPGRALDPRSHVQPDRERLRAGSGEDGRDERSGFEGGGTGYDLQADGGRRGEVEEAQRASSRCSCESRCDIRSALAATRRHSARGGRARSAAR